MNVLKNYSFFNATAKMLCKLACSCLKLSQVNEQSPKYSIMLHVMCKLFKHEQQETHLDTKNEKTNTLSWIFRVLQNVELTWTQVPTVA
jgi:hypothetical protein